MRDTHTRGPVQVAKLRDDAAIRPAYNGPVSTVSDELPTQEPAELDPITLPDPDADALSSEDATVADARAYELPTIETVPNPPDWIPPPPSSTASSAAAPPILPSRPIMPIMPSAPHPPILANPPQGSVPPHPAHADADENPFSEEAQPTVADIQPVLPPPAARSAPSLQVARSLDELQRWVQENRTPLRPWPQLVMSWSQRHGLPPWAPFAASGVVVIVLLLLIARC